MAGTQPAASSKLREALGEAQQNELDLRMRKAAELLRNGKGMYTWPGEPTVTNGVDRLREQLREAQGALRPDDQQKNGKPGAAGDDQLARALDQLERTRQRMQDMADSGQQGNQQGRQPGQSSQPGNSQQGGQPSNDRNGNADFGGPGNPHNGWVPDQVARDTQRDLNLLRQQLRDNPQLSGQVQDLLHQLQQATAFQNPQELSDRLSREILPEVERLELLIRRELGQAGSQVRNSASEPVPPGYADSVAEYFRKLSKSK
jgi:hypothetical protein